MRGTVLLLLLLAAYLEGLCLLLYSGAGLE